MAPVDIYQGGLKIMTLGEGDTHRDFRKGEKVKINGIKDGFEIEIKTEKEEGFEYVRHGNSEAFDSGIVAVALKNAEME